ncbi:MAG: TlyA family RNA methyltransferase [Clostridiales Family XIII bacterium]|nr:TlyA family RNA methyltransferase [Clostridiales Family XIII bacterium]
MAQKERIDKLLVARGLAPTREKAQAYIMAGSVRVGGQIELKAGSRYDEDISEIALVADPLPYVGRGGLKLKAALDEWGIGLSGLVCADIGASTGGFTDVMLQAGAAKVFAIDVGYGQLDYKLRNDSRVVNMERTNVRYMDPAALGEKVDFVSIDVSFISLKLIFPVAAAMLKPGAQIVALVKPQFEAGRHEVGKGGIVRDEKTHRSVIGKVEGYCRENSLVPAAVIPSPITGAKGNKEFLMLISAEEKDSETPKERMV